MYVLGCLVGTKMIYLKAPNQTREHEPLASWGAFDRFLEIGDDLYAIRQVDRFANGYSLRYDRSHWADEFGMLADMRYDEKRWTKWWGPGVATSAHEFEAIWRAAESSPLLSRQIESEPLSARGEQPPWLARSKDGQSER